MNQTSPSRCSVPVFLSLCASSKVLLLVPGFGLNIFILASVVSCLLSQQNKIRSNVAMFILGSTSCNLVSVSLWPMTIHWKQHGRWLLGSQVCEFMVSTKQLMRSASFLYVSFITLSVYLTVVCRCRDLVDNRVFLALQLLVPFLPVGVKVVTMWLLRVQVDHLDPVRLTCFSFINDRVERILQLVKTTMFLPLTLYFYAHILHTIVQSAKVMHRSQRVNIQLAKMFSLISAITFTAHIPALPKSNTEIVVKVVSVLCVCLLFIYTFTPFWLLVGAVFALMEHLSVCEELVRELLLDLPLLSSPVILLCMNKELRNQCLLLLQRRPTDHHEERHSRSDTDECSHFTSVP